MAKEPAVPKRRRTAVLVALLVIVLALVAGVLLYRGESGSNLAGPLGPQPGGIAVAVMPFDNASGDGQEFLSDGFADGVIGGLAKIRDLHIVGRESAFLKDGSRDDDELAQLLRATYRVGGSLRKSGNDLHVTAQLTVVKGRALWRQTYDRPFKDIAAVQEEIAQGIASALQVPVALKTGERLVPDRTADDSAYLEYLRAKAIVRARVPGKPLTEAIALLEQALAKDPAYAPAQALLAFAYDEAPVFTRAYITGEADEFRYAVATSLPKAEAAARQSIQRDLNLADGYAALGFTLRDRGQFVASEDAFKQALALDPDHPIALHGYSDMLAAVAHLKDALALRQQLMVLDPLVPAFNASNAIHLWLNAQDNAATAILRAMPPSLGTPLLAEQWAAARRYNSAADTLAMMPSDVFPAGIIQEAVRLLRTAPSMTATPQRLLRLNSLSWVYLHIGAITRALEFHEMLLAAGDAGRSPLVLWHPSYAPVRKTERFKAYVQKAGFVTYWRARGWPEFCHPGTGEDFTCE